jgi:hypothetical protein
VALKLATEGSKHYKRMVEARRNAAEATCRVYRPAQVSTDGVHESEGSAPA